MKQLHIVHLYPRSMNIYGDTGNVLVLRKRLEWRGVQVQVSYVDVDDSDNYLKTADIVFAGGGQDNTQKRVADDLKARQELISSLVQENVVMLTVCGTYQLFGRQFVTSQETLPGIGIFNMETRAKNGRLIGNIIVDSPFGELVGFENHGGRTYLDPGQEPIGTVLKGCGNNDETDDAGAVTKNAFGTYLHGPLLPKNSIFADELLKRALTRKYGVQQAKSVMKPLNTELENRAAEVAKERP